MKKYTFLLFLTIALLAVACFGWLYGDQPTELFYVEVLSGETQERITCWEDSQGQYYVFLPGYAQLSDVKIVLHTDTPVRIGGKLLSDGMTCESFSLDEVYDLEYSVFAKTQKKSVRFLRSGGVAAMYIDTQSGSMDYIHEKKGNEESGSTRLISTGGDLVYAGDFTSINGRGNYTWDNSEKKAYSLSLAAEANLLGMGQAQKWILLADASDPSHMRNKLVYEFAKAAGLAYAPDSQWVDLYLNGEYAGLYLLCERLEVHLERISAVGADGFLVSLEREANMIRQNYPYVLTASGQALRIHYPESLPQNAMTELQNRWQRVENAILAPGGVDPETGEHWKNMIDLESWARKYVIEELFGNHDAGYTSQYFYDTGSEEGGMIYAGPVWDYDLSMGNPCSWQLSDPYSYFSYRAYPEAGYPGSWFYGLYQQEEFASKVAQLYQLEFLPLVDSLLRETIWDYADQLAVASKMNKLRWEDHSADVYAQAEQLCSYMTQRAEFLSRLWIDGQSFVTVRAIQQFGGYYGYFAVEAGGTLKELPVFEDTDTSRFLGWYYTETDEPFDITKPLTEDLDIYAKWEDNASKSMNQILQLTPLGVIALLGITLLLVEFRRMKKSR